MYSIPENLDNTEFSGWINQDLLLKDSRRTTANRKRSYDLVNVDIDEQCDGLHRRMLRPRPNVSEPQSSPGASRTRPIRSNRPGRQPVAGPVQSMSTEHRTTNQHPTSVTPLLTEPMMATATNNDLSLFQALAAYNWPQNYLVAHTDPSQIIHRLHQPSYPHLNNIHLGQRMPQFDPWVLHNYLLASSGYSTIGNAHLPHESSLDDPTRSVPQLGYQSLSQVTRPPELNPGHNADPHSDLSYFFRSTNVTQRDSNDANLRNERMHSTMYQNDNPVANFNSHILPSPFSYASLCPYHNTNHIIHHNQQASHPMTANTSSNITDTAVPQQQQHSFNTFPHSPEMTFGHYWHQITPTIRPVNYPINSSNIDTLLHLAAHFEQRKRGITREELDKLPTHRHRVVPDKVKKMKVSTDKMKVNANEDLQQCLVCLDEFESKQSIRTLRCNHEFHAKCIDKWLKINRTCPLCRADAFDGTAQKDGA